MAANNVAKQLQENLKEMQVKCQEVMDRSCAASEVREKAVEQQNQLVADNCSESIKFAEDVDKLAPKLICFLPVSAVRGAANGAVAGGSVDRTVRE